MGPSLKKSLEIGIVTLISIACIAAACFWLLTLKPAARHWHAPDLVKAWSAQDGGNMAERNVSMVDGVVGKAFTFSPNSFRPGTYVGLQIPDRPEFILTNSLSIEGWVRPRGNGWIILCRGDHRPGLDPYCLSMQGNHVLRFQIENSENKTAYAETTLPYYRWTDVTATLDGDTGAMCLYTNGQLAAQIHTDVRPIGELLANQSPGVGIGNLNDGGNNFPFVGDIGEISLYSRALTADEIRTIYRQNAARARGHTKPLPAHYNPGKKES